MPSWSFGCVRDASIDLVSATWVLNEVTTSGILWLISHATRVLRKGGYVYLRDSELRKPLRHNINYDQLLQELGFSEVAHLDVTNRVDYYGVPRAYQKTTDTHTTYENLCRDNLSKFAVESHGGALVQDLTPRQEAEQK